MAPLRLRTLTALFCAFALMLGACQRSSPRFNAVDITGASYARDFRLTDPEGNERTLADFRGKVVVIFFGYTQCPDACPTALSELRAVMDALGSDSARVQVLFVTVDPERDTPALLASYVPAFHPSFLGLRAEAKEIAALARDYRVFYEKRPGTTPTTYTIDHSIGRYVYDSAGVLRLFVGTRSSIDEFAADIRTLLASSPKG